MNRFQKLEDIVSKEIIDTALHNYRLMTSNEYMPNETTKLLCKSMINHIDTLTALESNNLITREKKIFMFQSFVGGLPLYDDPKTMIQILFHLIIGKSRKDTIMDYLLYTLLQHTDDVTLIGNFLSDENIEIGYFGDDALRKRIDRIDKEMIIRIRNLYDLVGLIYFDGKIHNPFQREDFFDILISIPPFDRHFTIPGQII